MKFVNLGVLRHQLLVLLLQELGLLLVVFWESILLVLGVHLVPLVVLVCHLSHIVLNSVLLQGKCKARH